MMKTESIKTTIILTDTPGEEMPFVNEECGDTMWDEVLANTEDKTEIA